MCLLISMTFLFVVQHSKSVEEEPTQYLRGFKNIMFKLIMINVCFSFTRSNR